jgi:hypothetical protein
MTASWGAPSIGTSDAHGNIASTSSLHRRARDERNVLANHRLGPIWELKDKVLDKHRKDGLVSKAYQIRVEFNKKKKGLCRLP